MDPEDDSDIDDGDEEIKHGALPQLLMAANRAPRLRQLRIENMGSQGGSIFYSLAFLNQITALHIHGWISYYATEIRSLKGLRSLTEITLSNHRWATSSANVAKSTWETLAALKDLTTIKILFTMNTRRTHAAASFRKVSRLTHIRALSLERFHGDWDINGRLTSSVSVLTQLTSLSIGFLLASYMGPILKLPSLRKLHIGVHGKAPVSLAWQSRFLTSLTVEGDSDRRAKRSIQVDAALNPTFSCLSRLQILELKNWNLRNYFPASIAIALTDLRILKLHNCNLTCFPAAVRKIGTLEELYLEHNVGMELDFSDVPMLAALPRLHTLGVAKHPGAEEVFDSDDDDAEDNYAYSQRSLGVLLTIKTKLPHLALPGLS